MKISIERPRLKNIGLAVFAIFLLLTGTSLIISHESEADRVERALNDLASAVELRDPSLLETRIHPDYYGWGSNKESVSRFFRSMINFYENADVRLRNIEIEFSEDGETALVKCEWTQDSILRTELYSRIDTSLLPDRWEPATAVFQQDDAGNWLLLDADSEIPYAEPGNARHRRNR